MFAPRLAIEGLHEPLDHPQLLHRLAAALRPECNAFRSIPPAILTAWPVPSSRTDCLNPAASHRASSHPAVSGARKLHLRNLQPLDVVQHRLRAFIPSLMLPGICGLSTICFAS